MTLEKWTHLTDSRHILYPPHALVLLRLTTQHILLDLPPYVVALIYFAYTDILRPPRSAQLAQASLPSLLPSHAQPALSALLLRKPALPALSANMLWFRHLPRQRALPPTSVPGLHPAPQQPHLEPTTSQLIHPPHHPLQSPTLAQARHTVQQLLQPVFTLPVFQPPAPQPALQPLLLLLTHALALLYVSVHIALVLSI